MKLSLIAIFLILCISCREPSATTIFKKDMPINSNILKPEFNNILDSADVIGSVMIYDLEKDLFYSNDFEWSEKGHLPASTFKIANTIIGLETGIIESDSTIFEWDGKDQWSKYWEQDLILKDAFQFSCVPCYQGLARKIGSDRMNEYVSKLQYGNLKIDSTNIDNFWLQGESRISQSQQIDFLRRLYNSKLPISKRTESIIKEVMIVEENDLYKLSSKSGLSTDKKKNNGWYVGYIEINNYNNYIFATNIEPNKEYDFNSFIKKRKDITLSAFKELSIIK